MNRAGLLKVKLQDKDAEKRYYNRPIKAISRLDEEVFYKVSYLKFIFAETLDFASEIIRKEQMRTVSILEIGGMGDFYYALKKAFPEMDITLTVGDIAIMQLSDIKAPSYKVNLDLEHLPFKDNAFDFIFLNGVLHHIPNLEHCSRELMRVCKKCTIAVSEPCGNNPIVVISREISRFLSSFLDIGATVNETMHTMASYKSHFLKHGAKSVIVHNGDRTYSDIKNWHSYVSHIKARQTGTLRLLILLKGYMQRAIMQCFPKCHFSWNSFTIFIIR